MENAKENDHILQLPAHPRYTIQPMGSRLSIYTNSDTMDDDDRGMIHQSTLVRIDIYISKCLYILE